MVALIAGRGSGSWDGNVSIQSTVTHSDVVVYAYVSGDGPVSIPIPTGFGADWSVVQNDSDVCWAIGVSPLSGGTLLRTVSCSPAGVNSSGSSSAWVVRGLTSTTHTLSYLVGTSSSAIPASPGRALLATKSNAGVWPATGTLPDVSSWGSSGNTADAIPETQSHRIFNSESAIIGMMLIGSPPLPDPPVDLSVFNLRARSLSLDWNSPPASNSPTPDSYEWKVGDRTGVASITQADVTGLSPNTQYISQVRSVSGSYRSPWVSLSVKTLPTPRAPINLESVAVTETGFSVFWDHPPKSNAPTPERYQIRLNMGLIREIGLATDVDFSGLNSDADYIFEIRSYAVGDHSAWASLTVRTLPQHQRISWSPNRPKYHHGIDRGVLYPPTGSGVAWNGLVTVEENYVGGEFEPIHMDGIKRLNLPSGRNYQASLGAYSAPREFEPCNGNEVIREGLIVTRQHPKPFGMSYRSMLGEDLGYQLHLIYQAIATPTGRSYNTKNNETTPSLFTWTIDAVPVSSSAQSPTAHYILDSTEIGSEQMVVVESLLYGTSTQPAYLPSINSIVAIITEWDPKIIEEDYITGVSNLSSGLGDVQEVDVDGIYISLPKGRLIQTDVKGLYTITE